MSELENDPSRENQAEEPEVSFGHLKDQAFSSRQSTAAQAGDFFERPVAGWKQLLYLVLVFGSLFSVVFLLIEEESRHQVIASVGGVLYQGERVEINRLPPPPPKVIQARVVIAQGTGTTAPSPEEPRGILFLDQDPVRRGVEEEAPAPVQLPRTEFNQIAYNLLVRLSDAAARLSENSLEGLEFSSWRSVKDASPEFWIDLVALRQPEEEEVHLIWSVNTENERVTALSQAARDLETSL